jgi:hypothetical protein
MAVEVGGTLDLIKKFCPHASLSFSEFNQNMHGSVAMPAAAQATFFVCGS